MVGRKLYSVKLGSSLGMLIVTLITLQAMTIITIKTPLETPTLSSMLKITNHKLRLQQQTKDRLQQYMLAISM